MTILELKNQISGLTKIQREEKAISDLKDFMNGCDDIIARTGQSVDFGHAASMILSIAVASDGAVGREEYNFYKKLCAALRTEPTSQDQVQNFANNSAAAVAMVEDLAGSIKNVFITLDAVDVYECLVSAIACLLIGDGGIEGFELVLLSYFTDDVSSSQSAKSSVATNSAKKVELVDYEGAITRDDDRYYFTIGAILKNPNVDQCARNVNVKVIVKDTSGRILETSENTIDYIDSNATFYFGDEFSIDRGVPANYSVQINCDDFVGAPENSTFSNGITCSHYNVSRNRWGSTEFTGNVHNGYNKKLWVDLYFVFYNSAGKITGGTNTRATMYGNSDDSFDIYLNTNISRDKVRCSATFDFMDLVD